MCVCFEKIYLTGEQVECVEKILTDLHAPLLVEGIVHGAAYDYAIVEDIYLTGLRMAIWYSRLYN